MLDPKGKVFTEESIGDALASRELMAYLRDSGEASPAARPPSRPGTGPASSRSWTTSSRPSSRHESPGRTSDPTVGDVAADLDAVPCRPPRRGGVSRPAPDSVRSTQDTDQAVCYAPPRAMRARTRERPDPMRCEGGVNGLGQAGDRKPCGPPLDERVRLDGKFFRLGDEKFWVKGVTYGPFEPRPDGVFLPSAPARGRLRQIARPRRQRAARLPRAAARVARRGPGLRPEGLRGRPLVQAPLLPRDRGGPRERPPRGARGRPRLQGHPALFALSVVNELPPDVVRWLGPRRSRASSTSWSTSPRRRTRRRWSPSPASRPPSTCGRRRSTSTP